MAISEDILHEFQKIGGALFLAGLNNSHSGNISMRVGRKMFITRRGSMLGYLTDEDIIEVDLYEIDSNLTISSTESNVHKRIYLETEALAIVHAHVIAATALSIVRDEIIPIDVEGGYYVHKCPVIAFEFASGSKEMEETLPKYLKNYKVVMVKGHGAFAVGETLEEALFYIHSLENSARIILNVASMGIDPRKYEKDYYSKW